MYALNHCVKSTFRENMKLQQINSDIYNVAQMSYCYDMFLIDCCERTDHSLSLKHCRTFSAKLDSSSFV